MHNLGTVVCIAYFADCLLLLPSWTHLRYNNSLLPLQVTCPCMHVEWGILWLNCIQRYFNEAVIEPVTRQLRSEAWCVIARENDIVLVYMTGTR